MTTLMKQAMERLKHVPEDQQDRIALCVLGLPELHQVPEEDENPPLASMRGAAKGLHGSAEAIDAHIRNLRAEWD